MDVTFESPAFQEAEAVRLAAELYGLQVSAEPLPSERDRNFLLTAATGHRFVLKIANAGDDPAVIDLQNAALHRIGSGYISARRKESAKGKRPGRRRARKTFIC